MLYLLRWSVLCLAFWTVVGGHSSEECDNTTGKPILSIRDGKVQGQTLTSAKGRDFYAFMAIPYAKPPLNELRFKPPMPVEKWTGVFQANRKDILCPQFDGIKFNYTEDCLVLNVYTPQLHSDRRSKGLPVMVAFHEGAFMFGAGAFNFYDPTRFLDSDVVLVTTNYRLGTLGFLDTQDDESPGNFGMLDQVAALTWVRDNIRTFGGDPNRVSIFGCSAGGASTSYHLLSPLSKGLFKAAIIQSGAAIDSFAVQKEPLVWAKKVARLVNCTDASTTRKLVSCLRNATVQELITARGLEDATYEYPYTLGPSVQSKGERRFLTEHPLTLLSEGRLGSKVPVIIGTTRDEAFDPAYFRQFQNDTRKYFETQFCPFLIHVVDNNKVTDDVCRRAQREYFNSTTVDPDDFVAGMVKLTGDVGQSAGVAKTAEFLALAGIPVQAYKLTYIIQSDPINQGKFVRHGDEMVLMFDRRWPLEWQNSKLNFTSNDNRMSDFLRSIWSTFGTKLSNSMKYVIDDNATFDWPLYNSTNRFHAELDLNPKVAFGPLSDKMDFWQDIVWPST